MIEIFQYDFMVRSLIAGLAVGLTAPLIGSFLVMRRYSLISDTLSHVALAGVGLGVLLHIQPFIGALVVTIVTAFFIEKLRQGNKLPNEAVLAMFLPVGLAISVMLMNFAQGGVNYMSYLFGSVNTVTNTDVLVIVSFGIFVWVVVTMFYKGLLFAAFDEEVAKVSGVKVAFINSLLLVLTAVVVSVSMRIVGGLLVGALMVIPVMTAVRISKSFTRTLSWAVLFAVLAVIIGLIGGYYLNLPSGAAIVLAAGLEFLLVTVMTL